MKALLVPSSKLARWGYRLDTQAYFWDEANSDTGRRLRAARIHLRKAIAAYRNRKNEHITATQHRSAEASIVS